MTTHTTSAPFTIPAPPAASTTRATSHIHTTPAICMRMHMARWRAEPGAAGLTGSSPGGAVACP